MSNYPHTFSVSSERGSVSLDAEKGNHLANVVINTVNIPSKIIVSILPADLESYFFEPFYYFIFSISEICKICESSTECVCNCKCNTSCNGEFICLCLCNCTQPKAAECSICICKKKDEPNCKCICICICKKGDKCLCEEGQEHTCKDPLFKIDIGSLKLQAFKILWDLNPIRCCMCKFENQLTSNKKCFCCNDRCCVKVTCKSCDCQKCRCKREIDYPSTMSKVLNVIKLFKELGTKIPQFINFKNKLLCYSKCLTNCKACQGCNFKDKVEGLIKNIQNSEKYYWLFESRLYKLINVLFLRISVSQKLENFISISNHLRKSYIDGDGFIYNNNLMIINFSILNVTNYKSVINRLYDICNKIDQIFQIIISSDFCMCISSLEKPTENSITLTYTSVNNILDKLANKPNEFNNEFKLDEIRKINGLGSDSNHLCLCMVLKYVLYPTAVKLTYIISFELESLSTMSRKHDKYTNSGHLKLNISQLFIIVLDIVHRLTMFIDHKYLGAASMIEIIDCLYCFCLDNNDPYYPYLISIILYLSSLIENIWPMDNRAIVTAIQCLSSLLSEYQSIHVYTNYYSACLNKILKTSNNRNIEISGSIFGFGIGTNSDKKLLVGSNITGTGTIVDKKEDSTTTTYGITTGAAGLLNKTLKGGFMSLRTIILGTHFSKDKFSLIYNKFFCLCYIDEKCKNIPGSINMRFIAITISKEYLKQICKQNQKICSCAENKEYKICIIGKIGISCLYISLKKIEFVIGNVAGDMLLNYLMGSINRSEDFFWNLCVGFTEVYTAMTKNNLNSYSDHKNIANSFPSTTVGYKQDKCTSLPQQKMGILSIKILMKSKN